LLKRKEFCLLESKISPRFYVASKNGQKQKLIMSDRSFSSSAKVPTDVAETLDRILHSVANNQQVVFGRLELLLERDDLDDSTKSELRQVFRAVEENNSLISEVKKKVSEIRRSP
jgi:hypothetical protein